jgi:threonine aldolase
MEAGLNQIPGLHVSYAVESNAVFIKFPKATLDGLHARGWKFSTGVVTPNESRLMCSWDTTTEDIDSLVADVRELMA